MVYRARLSVDQRVSRVGGRESRRPDGGDEQLLERLPELAGHAAVDAEVERVGENDEKVDHRLGDHQIVVVQFIVDAENRFIGKYKTPFTHR